MARKARRGVCACIGAFAMLLSHAVVATADPNVIPIAGGGSTLGDGGTATAGSFAQALSVAVLHDYDFYYREYVVADYDHCRVRQVSYADQNADSDVGDISTVVGTGTCGDSGAASGATASTYKLDHPSSVSATPEHQVLIADSRNGRIDRWSPYLITGNNGANQAADTVTTLAGSKVDVGQQCAIPANDSAASAAKFCSLWRVAAHPWNFDTSGGGDKRFLVIDDGCAAGTGNCDAVTTIAPRVYLVYYDTGSSTWKIRTAAVGCGGAGAQSVCFTNPTGVAWTGSDTNEFLVTDGAKNQVQRFMADGSQAPTVVAGTGNATDDSHPIGDDGPPTSATFAQPSDIAMTGDGGYYVADTYNCRIRKVTDLTVNALIFSIGGTCGDGLPDSQTVSSFDADLWPTGLALGPAGLYVADFVTNQVKLFDRTTITKAPGAFTNATRPTFQVEALEGYGHFACGWDAEADHVCTTSAGGTLEGDNTPFQIPLDASPALGEGPHTFQACISDHATCSHDTDNVGVDPTPADRTFTIDTTAPQGLVAKSPAVGDSGLPPSPAFTWQAADGGPSGIDHYELIIDGTKTKDVPTSACNGGTCSATPAAPLSETTHSWKVRALDGAGNSAETAPVTFGSGSPPTASFTIAPNPVLTARAVTFDATASSDTSGPIARYEWDLDGDGTFETDGGSSPQTTKTYASAGGVTVQLRVTDAVGLTNVASGIVTVTAGTIAGQLGVTINNGAQFTNKAEVTLGIAAPATVSQLLVSNDGGFLAATTFAPKKEVAWKLDSSGPERLPKTVYVRFVQGSATSPNYTDDIILDERPPVVQQASIASAASAASIARLRAFKLKVKATDSNSGVDGVQVTDNKRKPGKLLKYRTKLSVKLAKRPKFLRARDRAGNYSAWKKLR